MRCLVVMGAEELVKVAQIGDAAIRRDLGERVFGAAEAVRGEIHSQGVDELRRALAKIAPGGAAHMRMGAACEADETRSTFAENGRILRGEAHLGQPRLWSLRGRLRQHILGQLGQQRQKECLRFQRGPWRTFKPERGTVELGKFAAVALDDDRL